MQKTFTFGISTMLFYYLLCAMPILSLLSIALYWYDKRSARTDSRRVPELTLLTVDLLGGWPGGWWAQQRFRHKTQKSSFRIRFYIAIALNLALVFLIGCLLYINSTA